MFLFYSKVLYKVELEKIIMYIIGLLLGVAGYHLRKQVADIEKKLDKVDENVNEIYDIKTRVRVLENNHNHLSEKFDQLYVAVTDLTKEIKHLTIALSKKKDI